MLVSQYTVLYHICHGSVRKLGVFLLTCLYTMGKDFLCSATVSSSFLNTTCMNTDIAFLTLCIKLCFAFSVEVGQLLAL